MDETPCMASPQAENGHIDIAHELAEAFFKLQLSGYQWRLLWVIFRQTYGWKKKQDRISFSFFEKRTGIDRRNIAHALSDLTKRKIIVKNNNGFIVSYGIQKDYFKWICKPLLKSTTRKHKTKSNQEDTSKISKSLLEMPLLKSTTKPLLKSTPTKETKETILEKIFFEISLLENKYSNKKIISEAFAAISKTRKSNRIAETVKLKILQAWDQYPVESVESGIRKYLEKGRHLQGKKENYLLVIIKDQKPSPDQGAVTGPRYKEITPENIGALYEN